MSLQITSEPFEISMSNNPIDFLLNVTNYLDGENVYPSLELRIVGKLNAGTYYSFKYLDPVNNTQITVRFDAVANYDESGKEVPDSTFVGTQGEYLEEMVRLLAKNPLINMQYVVSTDSSQFLYLTAKLPEENLIPTDIETTTPITSVVSSQFYEAQIKENYNVVCEVWMETDEIGSQNFKMISRLVDYPDNQGRISFNVQSPIHAELKESFNEPPLPDLLNDQVYESPLRRRFYLRFAEVYGEDSESLEWQYSNQKEAYFGGISEEDFAKANVFMWLQVKERFLSWHDFSKKLNCEQKDWLSWCNYTNKAFDARVSFKIFYKNGAESLLQQVPGGTISLDKWGVITFPIGFEQLDIEGISAGNIPHKWEIFIDDANTLDQMSQTFTIFLDDTYEECGREIVYLNSFNCPETIFTKNGWQKKLGVAYQKNSKTLTHDYSVVNGQRFRFNNVSENTYVVKTGYLTNKITELIQDMLTRSSCFILEGGIYVPAYVDSKSFVINDCYVHLAELNFTIVRAFNITNYSNMNVIPKLVPIYSCGLVGFGIDNNGVPVDYTSLGDLTIENSDQSYSETVAWNPSSQQFPLTPITAEDTYTVTVDISDDNGESYAFNFDFVYQNKAFTFLTNEGGLIQFDIQTATTSVNGYIDYGDGSGPTAQVYSPSTVLIFDYLGLAGTKIVRGELPCVDDVVTFRAVNQRLSAVNLRELPNIMELDIVDCDQAGIFNIDNLIMLQDLDLQGNDLTGIRIGFMKDIVTIDLDDNDIGQAEIERFLKDIWKFRKLYSDTASIVITLSNNPGVAPLSAEADDIINGNNAYNNEGLVPDYGMTIIT